MKRDRTGRYVRRKQLPVSNKLSLNPNALLGSFAPVPSIAISCHSVLSDVVNCHVTDLLAFLLGLTSLRLYVSTSRAIRSWLSENVFVLNARNPSLENWHELKVLKLGSFHFAEERSSETCQLSFRPVSFFPLFSWEKKEERYTSLVVIPRKITGFWFFRKKKRRIFSRPKW